MRSFVARTDELGGPDAHAATAWWEAVAFDVPPVLRASADQLHALSRDYFALQDKLYESIVGAPYRDTQSELTPFDKDEAVSGHLAYPHCEPRNLNSHVLAMARMVEQFDRPDSLRILEAGSGWGFSTEYLARLGHTVVGVDVNPDFIETASRRSQRLGLGIEYRLGTFERLPAGPDEQFDVIFTSAAFHHSRDPLAALRGMVARLAPGGQVILASEPFIPAEMWPCWGLRTDPLSVYCIAKFGWWESGWTRAFMGSAFRSAGLRSTFIDGNSGLECYMVGRVDSSYGVDQLSYRPLIDGWQRDRNYLVSGGDSRIEFYRPLSSIVLSIESFAPAVLSARFESQALPAPIVVDIVPGSNRISVPLAACPQGVHWAIRIISQTWNPLRVLGNGEDRELSFHLCGVEEEPAGG